MSWEVEYTNEFGDWWSGLSEDAQEALAASVRLLEERGPAVGLSTQQWNQRVETQPHAGTSHAARRQAIANSVRV